MVVMYYVYSGDTHVSKKEIEFGFMHRAYDKNSLLSCHNVLANQNWPDNYQN